MSTEPGGSGAGSTADRLPQIERSIREWRSYDAAQANSDEDWLIVEVKRLRADLESARAEIERLKAAGFGGATTGCGALPSTVTVNHEIWMILKRDLEAARAIIESQAAEIERLAFDGAINQAMFEMLYRVYPDSPDNHYKSLGLLTRLIADLSDARTNLEAAREAGRTLAVYVRSLVNPSRIPKVVVAALEEFTQWHMLKHDRLT